MGRGKKEMTSKEIEEWMARSPQEVWLLEVEHPELVFTEDDAKLNGWNPADCMTLKKDKPDDEMIDFERECREYDFADVIAEHFTDDTEQVTQKCPLFRTPCIEVKCLWFLENRCGVLK